MALGTSTSGGSQGQTNMRPSGILRLTFLGDGTYPDEGTLAFAATYLRTELSRDVTVTQVTGYSYSAGDVATHFTRYMASTDALKVYVLATGAEAAPGDLSAFTFDVEVHYH